MNNILWELSSDKVAIALKQGRRLDGRKFDEYRSVSVQYGVSENANGSARVKLGETDVIAGTKFDVNEPYPDTPNEGSMAIGMEFLPMASPSFETGPPGEEEIELSRTVDRGIRHSHCIDFADFVVVEGEKVLVMYVDLYALNFDGNMFDAASIAALGAMLNTRLPKVESGEIVVGEYAGKLKLSSKPLLSTFAKIDNAVVLDPNMAEDHALHARMSISTTESDYITAFQKGGDGSFSLKEVNQCVDWALVQSKAVRKLL